MNFMFFYFIKLSIYNYRIYTGVFLIKMSKIQLNIACLLYWTIFTEIDKKLVI